MSKIALREDATHLRSPSTCALGRQEDMCTMCTKLVVLVSSCLRLWDGVGISNADVNENVFDG